MKKINVFFIAVISLIFANVNVVLASTEYYTGEKDNHLPKDSQLVGITDEMNTAEYWLNKTIYDSDKVLSDIASIKEINKYIVDNEDNYVPDLINGFDQAYDADKIQSSLANVSVPTRAFYVGDTKLDNQTYFTKMIEAIKTTGYTGTQKPIYAVCTNRVNMKDWPTDDYLKYTIDDTDDEIQSSAMNTNEPFVIKAKCVIDNQVFYWGYSLNCTGWVNGKNIAICDTKEDWLNYWNVDGTKNDFVVITDSKINMKLTNSEDIKLMLGTILKLVPDNLIPTELKDKKTDNYIVYLPSKDSNGKAVIIIGLLPKSLNVNQGFLKLTESNILKVAFSCLGDEYGWGCANDNMDCSAYLRQIANCFGYSLARNTTRQLKVGENYFDISSMSDEDKMKLFSTLPSGAMFYFNGHTMMYLGEDNGKYYIISDLGSVYDTDGLLKYPSTVAVNSLDVRRGNGKTWLTNLHSVVYLAEDIDLKECEISLAESTYTYDETMKCPEVTVKYNGNTLYLNINYTVEYLNNTEAGVAKVIVKGINNYGGQVEKTFEIVAPKPVEDNTEIVDNPEIKPEIKTEKAPATGDYNNIYVFLILAIFSMTVGVVAVKKEIL